MALLFNSVPARPVVILVPRLVVAGPGRGFGDFSAVANFIQQMEGWFPGSISYRNNNPGNLIFAGQPGAIPSSDKVNGTSYSFAKFATYQDGYTALQNQIALDAGRGETISQFTHKIASGPTDNPNLYADKMAAALGMSTSDLLSAADAAAYASPAPSDYYTGPDTSATSSSLDIFGVQVDPVLAAVGAAALGLLVFS